MTSSYNCATDEAIELHERASVACLAAQWVEAEQATRQSLAIFESEDGLDSPDAANLSNLLSEIAEAQGQYAAAETNARRAWEIMERLGSHCTGHKADAIRGEALLRLGTALRGAGRYEEAESWLVRALEYAERTGQGLPAGLNALGVLCKYSGRFAIAERLYRSALALVEENSREAATLHHNLGGLAHVRGEFAAGLADARHAWEIRCELRGPDHPETLSDACAYATLLDGLGRYDESEAIYQAALARLEELFGSEHLEIAVNLSNLAALRWAQGDAAEAEALYRRAAVMKGKLLGVSHPDTALTLHNYASNARGSWARRRGTRPGSQGAVCVRRGARSLPSVAGGGAKALGKVGKQHRGKTMKNWRSILAAGVAASIMCGMAAGESRASLYERLGGMPAIRAVVDDFVSRILADNRVNGWFAHAASSPEAAAAYKSKLADFLCQGTGGPCHYTGADIATAHKGRGVTEEAFTAVVEDLTATLDKFHVPEKEKADLLSILAPMKPVIVQH